MRKFTIPPRYSAGIFFIVILLLMGILLQALPIRFSIEILIIVSLVLTLIVYIPVIKKERKSTAIVSLLLLLLSICAVFYASDFLLLGPKGEQIPYLYLIANLRDEEGVIDPHWISSEWRFYKPKCYLESSASKYDSTSLELAVFYYGKTSHNPIHSGLKYLYTKLSCGITDSKTAYERYKELLLNSGFSIESRSNNFTARNETTMIYCQLDGDFIMVVKVNENEEYLLNHTKILRGKF